MQKNKIIDNNQLSLDLTNSRGSVNGSSSLDSTVISGNRFNVVHRNRGRDVYNDVKYSFTKVIKTGDYIEVFKAELPFLLDRGYSNVPRVVKDSDINLLYPVRFRTDEYKFRTAKLGMDRIRRLSLGNFKDYEIKHIVLTFSPKCSFNIKDLGVCNKKFNDFMHVMKSHYPYLKYIKVAEYTRAGNVHFHVICNLHFVPSKQIGKYWGNGYIWIRKAPYNIARYMFKYLLKNVGDSRFSGHRCWCHSSNMVDSQVIYRKSFLVLRDIDTYGYSVTFEYVYKSMNNGIIHVTEYDLQHGSAVPIISDFERW
jgi:hypothetical protein